MKTPIYDFVLDYKNKEFSRFHMPGHKGKGELGAEALDITEISGADELFAPTGIIEESENNASYLFGSFHSFYSTEGSSLCIKAMLGAVCEGMGGKILASRNAHKAFLHGAVLLDLEVTFIGGEGLLSGKISPEEVEKALQKEQYTAVYITSPDYLGGMADIMGISEVCKKYDLPLLVDNAHGAYLRFLENSLHPMDLGADMCCDSAHKTLPVLTGGAYLHIKSGKYADKIRKYTAAFGSTSPSYLILQSLDLCNLKLSGEFKESLKKVCLAVEKIKATATESGFVLRGDEPLKLCVELGASGYKKAVFLSLLGERKIELEFCDNDFAVFMFSPYNSPCELDSCLKFFKETAAQKAIITPAAKIPLSKRSLSIRDAFLSENEEVRVENALGRVCADVNCSCPPAVPIVISGEIIEKQHIDALLHYGISKIWVVK